MLILKSRIARGFDQFSCYEVEMKPYQERVVNEKFDLQVKLKALEDFANGDAFEKLPPQEQARLHLQGYLMRGYIEVLEERIDAFDAA